MRYSRTKFGFGQKRMPISCPDCKGAMPEPKSNKPYGLGQIETLCRCGCIVRWEFPNVFKRRHQLPLFDDGKVLGHG